MTSGGSRRRECPASAKKPTRSPTGAVCRSCTTMPVSTGASPSRRERRYAFPGSRTRRRHLAGRVPRAKRLGRSERSEIPVQEICTWREIQEIRVFLLDRTRIFGYIVSVIFLYISNLYYFYTHYIQFLKDFKKHKN